MEPTASLASLSQEARVGLGDSQANTESHFAEESLTRPGPAAKSDGNAVFKDRTVSDRLSLTPKGQMSRDPPRLGDEPSTQTRGRREAMKTDRPAHAPGPTREPAPPTFLGCRQVWVTARQGPVPNVIEQQPLERYKNLFLWRNARTWETF